MVSRSHIALFFIFFIYLSSSSSANPHLTKRKPYKPCKELVLFFHDILYNGHNKANATSAIVAGPKGSNRTILADDLHFGNIIVFNNPLTIDDNLHSPPVGWAQGMYMYVNKDVFGAWFSLTFSLNSTEHQGTINLMGADPMMIKTRDFSIVGGTGDFFMHRGVATISTGSFEGDVYFRIRIDMKFYDCW
ncbi:Dirigent protein [Linum perenne]